MVVITTADGHNADYDFNVNAAVPVVVEEQFQIGAGMVHLTSPTFFSEISDRKARTEHDEYWHLHVDKVTYGKMRLNIYF